MCCTPPDGCECRIHIGGEEVGILGVGGLLKSEGGSGDYQVKNSGRVPTWAFLATVLRAS